MKILITGITGLLGHAIANEVFSQGHKVMGVSRNNRPVDFGFPVKMFQRDLGQESLDDRFLSGVDVIIHSAADTQMGSLPNKKQDLMNVKAVEHLLKATLKYNIHYFLFVSTANTLMPGTASQPGTEQTRLQISSSVLNYIRSKIKAEKLVLQAVKKHGLNGLIFNPTFIFNPNVGRVSSNKLLDFALKSPVLFYFRGGKNIVDARDVAKAMMNAMEKGRAGESYLLAGKNYTYKEFFQRVLKIQNRKAILVPVPGWFLWFAGAILSAVERIVRKPFELNLRTARMLNANHYYDNSKAVKELDFQPRKIKDIINDRIKKEL